jgi:hypothetical protein
MKDVKEYLMQTFYNGSFIELHSGDIDDVVDIMKQVQVDAYNQAIIDTSKNIIEGESTRINGKLFVSVKSVLKLKK